MIANLLFWISITWASWWPTNYDTVYLSRDLNRFPSKEVCLEQSKVAECYRNKIDTYYKINDKKAWTWTLSLEEQERIVNLKFALNERSLIWYYLYKAKDPNFNYKERINSLQQARILMGEEDFWSGILPSPIPYEYLREMD